MNRSVEVNTYVRNTPEAVIAFISDVRNRTRYVPSLKSVSDVQGDAAAGGQTWNWRFAALGMEFEGTARSTACEPGRLYVFQTEGELQSMWTYQVEPEGEGTRLTLRVEYSVPDEALQRLPADVNPDALEQAEAEAVFKNLKAILDR